MSVFFFLLLFPALVFSQPSWLSAPSQPPALPGVHPPQAAAGAPVSSVKAKTVVKVDTLVIRDTVEKTIIDTLYVPPPKVLRFKYKLQICNLDYNRLVNLKINLLSFDFYRDILDNLNNEEKMKNCYFSSTYSDSNYVYSYGMETVRSNGFIYDNYGNKLEQTEKVLTGVTLSVKGDNVKFDYLENKKLMLHNAFNDGQVNFYADYTFHEYRCNFWIFCNNMQKKQYLFLNLTREEI